MNKWLGTVTNQRPSPTFSGAKLRRIGASHSLPGTTRAFLCICARAANIGRALNVSNVWAKLSATRAAGLREYMVC